jgi:hypothetical protein
MDCGIYPLLGRRPRRLSPPKWVRQLSLIDAGNLSYVLDEVEIPRIRKFGHKNTLVNGSTNDSGGAALLTVANRLVAHHSSLSFLFRVNKFLVQAL